MCDYCQYEPCQCVAVKSYMHHVSVPVDPNLRACMQSMGIHDWHELYQLKLGDCHHHHATHKMEKAVDDWREWYRLLWQLRLGGCQ